MYHVIFCFRKIVAVLSYRYDRRATSVRVKCQGQVTRIPTMVTTPQRSSGTKLDERSYYLSPPQSDDDDRHRSRYNGNHCHHDVVIPSNGVSVRHTGIGGCHVGGDYHLSERNVVQSMLFLRTRTTTKAHRT